MGCYFYANEAISLQVLQAGQGSKSNQNQEGGESLDQSQLFILEEDEGDSDFEDISLSETPTSFHVKTAVLGRQESKSQEPKVDAIASTSQADAEKIISKRKSSLSLLHLYY